jgi:murein DD-endopeptidase MepM/ murein hydrolase activator NlpD
MTGQRRIACNLLLLALAMLPACSFMYPSKPYMPSRSGIQSGGTITVKPNENIYAIAREHNVSMRDLIVLNNLKPPYEVSPGQRLELPSGGTSFSGDTAPAPAAAPLGAVEKNELAPIEPASVSSESLEPIASQPSSPSPHSGMPFGTGPSASAVVPALKQQPAEIPPIAAQATKQAPVPALNRPTPAQKPMATTMTEPTTGGDVDLEMAWPVQGPILSPYGATAAGLHNDGVNIGAPKGAPVTAAAPGTVVYAGNEMKGFGNLVLIRHQGDWVTAYAHLDRVLVKKDSVVGQGDMIGTVGKTGNVSTPQLHFETRRGGKPVDPASVIKSGQ